MPSTKKNSRSKPPRLTKAILHTFVADICKRLEEQSFIAEALERAAKPNGETMVGAYPMLKVLELAAAAHAGKLREAHRFACATVEAMERAR